MTGLKKLLYLSFTSIPDVEVEETIFIKALENLTRILYEHA